MKNLILTAATIMFCSIGLAQSSSSTNASATSADVQNVEARKATPAKGGCCSMAEGKPACCADKSSKSCAPKSEGKSSDKPAQKSNAKARTEN